MKTEYREVHYDLDGVELRSGYNGVTTHLELVFNGNKDYNNLKIHEPIQVPETLSEFRELKDLTKEGLLDWLIENYK